MRRTPLTACLALLLLTGAAHAQCSSFQSAYPGLNGAVRALASWDRDGNGPRLVAGGAFTWDQQTSQDYIAYWDGTTWADLGWGTDGPVNAITTWDPDGDGPLPQQLIIGGEFAAVGADSTGQVAANHIARWDGAAWRALATGIDGPIYALETWDPDGPGPLPALLIAAGDFHHAGGIAADDIAAWDGTAWRRMGWGFNGPVHCLTAWDRTGPQNPVLLAGGEFVAAGSDATGQVTAQRVAAWDGVNWTGMNEDEYGAHPVTHLVTFDFDGSGPNAPSPVILYGGSVMRWNGGSWVPFWTTQIGEIRISRALTVVNTGAAGPRLWIAADTFIISKNCQPPFCTECCYRTDPGPSIIWGVDALGQGPATINSTADVLGNWDPDGSGPLSEQLVVAGTFPGYINSYAYQPAPVITSQPEAARAPVGGAAQFTFGVIQPPATTYQWFQSERLFSGTFYSLSDGVQTSGSTITGSTTPTLTIQHISYLDGELAEPYHGNYYTRFRCLANSACGSAWSNIARLDIAPCSADFNHDGDSGTDADIESFFSCLAGNCCPTCDYPDFNGDGDVGTDQDIDAFFRVLAGGHC